MPLRNDSRIRETGCGRLEHPDLVGRRQVNPACPGPAATLHPRATAVGDLSMVPVRTLEEHLDPGRPKRILSLDGGGVKGIITIAFLEKIEEILKKRSCRGDNFRLSDYFDLVGGTSVGALLATLI